MSESIDITIATDKEGTARLTTEHAASSYGLPVLVIKFADGKVEAYGPNDLIAPGVKASDGIRGWAAGKDRTPDEKNAARAFLSQAPGEAMVREIFQIPIEMQEALKARAGEDGISKSEVIRNALRDYLDK